MVLEASQAVASYWIHVKGIGPCALDETYQLAILRYIGDRRREPASQTPGYDGLGSPGPVTALHKLSFFSPALKSDRHSTGVIITLYQYYFIFDLIKHAYMPSHNSKGVGFLVFLKQNCRPIKITNLIIYYDSLSDHHNI